MPTLHELGHEHFRNKRGELLSIEVEELGGARLYYYARLKGSEVARLVPFINMADPTLSDYALVFEAFAVAARDEKGVPLFTSVNKHEISELWDWELVSTLVDRMGVLTQIFLADDDAKKN